MSKAFCEREAPASQSGTPRVRFIAPARGRRCIAFLIAVQVGLFAIGVDAKNALRPNVDVAQFFDSDGNSYLEIYYSVSRSAIKYVPGPGNGHACQLIANLRIYQAGAMWSSKIWKIEETVQDTTGFIAANQLVDVLRYQAADAGAYRVVLQIQDTNGPAAPDSGVAEIELRKLSPGRVEMSDLQLASSITSSANGQPTVFSKQVYEVVPNPAALFGEGAADLYYYFEAYHLLNNISGRKYKVVSHVQRLDAASGENMASQHLKSRRFDSIAEVGKMNISKLPTGSYRLVGGIADSAGTMLASREKKFFVYNPSVSSASAGNRSGTAAAAGPLQTMSEKELDDEFERMLYLMMPRDRAMYKSLKGAEAKRAFVSSIWQSPRGEEALTGMAFREQYLARAREAGARFKSPARPGWKSDRGRVFILYGPADRLDRFPSTNTSLPYETWSYDHLSGQGGVVFVFADRTGYNHYEQIHSTLEGELQDQNWQKFITRGSGGDNTIE